MHEKRFNREIEKLRDPDRVTLLEVDRVIDLSLEGLIEPSSVLDIGTGSGLFAEKFSSRGLLVAGVDANSDMLPVASLFVPKGDFRIGEAEQLPFETDSFDLLFMGLLLHEVDNLQAAINEAYRVAQKRLAVLEWVYQEQPFGPPLEHRLTFDKIKAASISAGFKSIQKIRLTNLVLFLLEK